MSAGIAIHQTGRAIESALSLSLEVEAGEMAGEIALTETEWMVQPVAVGEVHSEVTSDKCDRGEENGDDGHDHHEIIRSWQALASKRRGN